MRGLPGVACAVALALAAPPVGGFEVESPAERTILVALDAVPWKLVAELTAEERGERALFPGMGRPARMVSTFPSTTSVALGGMLGPLGLERSPGYEARFFDRSAGRVRGGGPFSYFRIDFAWRDFFDLGKRGPAASAISALRPVRSSLGRLEKGLETYLGGDLYERQESFWVYVGATDLAGHLKGPEALARVLVRLDRLLDRSRRRYPDRPFRTVLFSDHGIAGGEPLRNVWRPVKRALRDAGFRRRKRLVGADDVALTPFGLVSSFEIYCRAGCEPDVARAVVAVPGVDLCAYRAEGGWTVASARGAARIERRRRGEGSAWRYRPVSGDPLLYAPVAARLAKSGESDRFVADRRWFEATAVGHRYPDALHRIARAFELVENPASLVCSVDDGHMFGARRTEIGSRLATGRLEWTHGALEAEATLGFVLSDVPGWREPAAVRFDESLTPFAAAGGRPAVAERSEPPVPGRFRRPVKTGIITRPVGPGRWREHPARGFLFLALRPIR